MNKIIFLILVFFLSGCATTSLTDQDKNIIKNFAVEFIINSLQQYLLDQDRIKEPTLWR